MTTAQELRERAAFWPKGRFYEDFAVGQEVEHHWGRTILASDNVTISSLCLAYHPMFHNREYARATGHDDLVVNPMLLFLVVFGMSVEDLSEIGGAFLGVDDLTFHRDMVVGETVVARSVVTNMRASKGRPGQGIVTWRTAGYDQYGALLIDFQRTNLISKKGVNA